MSLLERDTQLRDLKQAFADAQGGRGRTVTVAGEAGIGKTTLVETFGRECERDARVLWGACEALFTPRPLGPFYDVVHALGGPLRARLESEAQPVDLFHGLLDAVRRHEQPTIIVIEDLHWADGATLDFVRFTARRIEKTPGLLVLTYRDDEVGTDHPLNRVLGEVPATSRVRLKLPALSHGTVADLATKAGHRADEVFRITGGNPFFVTEVLRDQSGAVAPSVREAVLARAHTLSREARAIVDLASIVPDSVELALLHEAWNADLAPLEESLQRGILALADDRVFFRHELVRRALEDAVPALRRKELNARMLAALVARPGSDLARIAHHAVAAGDAMAVVQYSPRAATAATARGAHREAGALLAAVQPHLASMPAADRAAYLEQRASACHLLAAGEDAVAFSRDAHALHLESGDSLAAARNLARRTEFLIWGRFKQAATETAAVAREAIASLEAHPAARDALALAHAAIAFASAVSDPTAARASSEKSLALAAELEHAAARVRVLTVATMAEMQLFGAPDRASAERLMTDARAARDDYGIISAYLRQGWALARAFELEALERTVEEGIAFGVDRQLDRSFHFHVLRRLDADAAAARGRWNEAAERYRTFASLPGQPPAVSFVYCHTQLELLAAREGRDFSLANLAEGMARESALYAWDRYHLHRTVAEIAWLAGDSEQARRSAQTMTTLAASWNEPWARAEARLWSSLTGASDVEIDARATAEAWLSRGYVYHALLALAAGDEAAQREALERCTSLGVPGTAERLRERMREQGIRSIPIGPRASTRTNAAGITDREMEVLELLAQGLANATIAARLHRSVRTIENHVASLTTKLGVENRHQAVIEARRRRLVTE